MDKSVGILDPISQEIWDMKYRFKDADGTIHDQTIEDTWWRVARAVAEAEKPPLREPGPPPFMRRFRISVLAGRTHRGGRRHRAQRHDVQLLRHGHHR